MKMTNTVAIATPSAPVLAIKSIGESAILSDVTFNEEVRWAAIQAAKKFSIQTVAEAGIYGRAEMQSFNDAISNLLKDVRMGDLGKIGDIVADVENATENMRLRALYDELQVGSWRNRMAKLPIVGRFLSTAKFFLEQRDRFLDLTAQMERSITIKQQGIRDHNMKLNQLIDEIGNNYRDLSILIVAGEIILKKAVQEYEEATKSAVATRDPLAFSNLQMMHEKIQAFDVRLMNLKMAYVSSPTTALQAQIGQSAQRMTIEHLSNIKDFVIRELKMAVLQAEGMIELDAARAEADRIQKTTDAVSAVGVEMLRDNYLGSKRAQGQSYERAEKLGQIIGKISQIVADGRAIDAENVNRRRDAEKLLVQAVENQRNVIAAYTAPVEQKVA